MGLFANMFGLAVKGAKNVAGVQSIIETNKGALALSKTDIIKGQLAINANDAMGKSWIQRNWRPLFMMSIVIMVIFNYLILPIINMIITRTIYEIIIPDQLWQAFMVGFGVYSAGRTYEKIKVNSAKAPPETTGAETPQSVTKQETKKYRDLGMSAEDLASK
ncbi:MAG: holin family protein [Alphaproteobacteria bacterium]|nr:holin family protein [Alphaproteobacteria bacterium]